ncbi:MAG: YigZ family protein [Gemmatimonadaceae bacterium]
MGPDTRYFVPARRHRVERSIERSRFICTVERVETAAEAQAFVRDLNAEFADATHNCWAYVAGPPGSTNVIGMSDAGEPHGTAGRPMLTVLLHGGVGEIAAIVTRYYGGTKLGTGGLVKAYGGVVQSALETLCVVERIDFVEVAMSFGYPSITLVQQAIVSLEAEVIRQEYGVDVRYRLRVPRANSEKLRAAIADATHGEGEFRVDSD